MSEPINVVYDCMNACKTRQKDAIFARDFLPSKLLTRQVSFGI
jgi:hypothetical protein